MTALPEADVSGLVVRLYWVAFLDIAGDPVRATTLPYGHTFTGTGDSDLDDVPYAGLDHNLVDISPVVHGKGGSDMVTATLRGLPGIDDDLLAAIEVKANWQGRVARLWHGIIAGGAPTAPVPYYTGYMNRITDSVAPDTRAVTVEIENYLAMLTTPRGRTYQHQTEHDSGDLSPLRMRSAANGTAGAGIPVILGGSANSRRDRQYEQLK